MEHGPKYQNLNYKTFRRRARSIYNLQLGNYILGMTQEAEGKWINWIFFK